MASRTLLCDEASQLRMAVSFSISTKAARRLTSRGEMPAVSCGFEQQNRQAKRFTQGLRFGTPEITTREMPKHDAAHPTEQQARFQPGVEPRVGPLENVHDVIKITVHEHIQQIAAGGQIKWRDYAALAIFGCVQNNATARSFNCCEQISVCQGQRPADERERHLISGTDRRRFQKSPTSLAGLKHFAPQNF